MGDVIRKMGMLIKNQKERLAIKNTDRNKECSEGPISWLDLGK